MRLSPLDFDAYQRATLALHDCRDVQAFARALPRILLKMIPADHFFLQEIRFSPKMNRVHLVRSTDPLGQVTPEMERFSEAAMLDHPFPKDFARTGDWSARILSDFLTVGQFRRTEVYQRFYRFLRVDRLLGLPVDFGQGTLGGITLGNKVRDYTERDRLLLNLLRPHIELARRNAKRQSEWKESHRRSPPDYELTRRESQIADWLKAGKTNAEIAIILQSNVRTVEKHVEKILLKLRVENRTAAAIILIEGRPPHNGSG